MITRHVKILVECEVRADVNPTVLTESLAKNFGYSTTFKSVKTTLISASPLDDPFAPINEKPRQLRKRRRLSRFALSVALRRLGLS